MVIAIRKKFAKVVVRQCNVINAQRLPAPRVVIHLFWGKVGISSSFLITPGGYESDRLWIHTVLNVKIKISGPCLKGNWLKTLFLMRKIPWRKSLWHRRRYTRGRVCAYVHEKKAVIHTWMWMCVCVRRKLLILLTGKYFGRVRDSSSFEVHINTFHFRQ